MNIKQLSKVICIFIASNAYADKINNLNLSESAVNDHIIQTYYKPTYYRSDDYNVDIEYMQPILKNNNNKGFISKIVICNTYQCKKFNYKLNQVKVIEIEPSLLSFNAKLNDGNSVTGFICNDHLYECKSYVLYDIKTNDKDVEHKFYLTLEKNPINISKFK